MTLSQTLRRAIIERRLAGMRQYVLANRIGLHPSLLSHLINGSIPIRENDPRVLKLAQALGVLPEEALVESTTSEGITPMEAA